MSATNLSTVSISDGDLTYDADLTVGQVRRMSSTDGEVDSVIGVLSELIVEWPYAGNPSDSEAWDDLKLTQFNDVVAGITEGLGKGLAE